MEVKNMQAKRVKAELQTFEVAIVKALNQIMAGKRVEEQVSVTEWVFGENVRIVGLDFGEKTQPNISAEEYINSTVNHNVLGYSMKDGNCYNGVYSGEKGLRYDPAKWYFFWFNYSQEVEEPTYGAAFNPETGRLDILGMTYTAPDNWWIEESTWLIRS